MKRLLIFLLLRGRKEYFDIVSFKGKKYKIVIEEFIPASKWVSEAKKTLQKAEPKIR